MMTETTNWSSHWRACKVWICA